ncbi:hypothetical protein C343_05181 [Cryptococcus neoformans C23]|uniref:Uncharacterized protein n=1 Tax=Cryptococcus neoformans (strain H99 / ATCC 208821 / CBS 10515 / FGSC 9487) TaxID=235443 RepID=J9VS10_CRYN9|nr:hypothetical protein CNAG_04317 [Cryptococcus neoformans var. grubii H99]AUB27027.1 hypothetical protein CKF44_04317 [Cryptococcus neoformans var. grubii]OWZ29354.1 hypothetical protein C347_05227 [Cryptococcus neoformans var. grubii AD2-60a]OWZ41220.1 hypothetical protein C343_05181 [Cryptococcus neoformans var. grubii C23]OXC82921.1 hypothetical protein C344_04905 [Cryptococcus neoformans var. grubii AD1-7a]AFR97048.1 hypothetical protein CNAG_04317 [Cryptococcus neoformans var. grubii H9|eukprot:XP_012051729.1 hypothetical protein CNAG_04317 [Cryptococcus neoformans var. grubii H99]
MAASKKPSAGPCPPSDTRYSRGESDNSGSSTEIDSDKEIAASNFGNEGKEKAVPDAFQYPLRTSEAKKTVNLEEHDKRTQQRREIKSSGINTNEMENDMDNNVSDDNYSTDTTAVESDTKNERWKNRNKASFRKPSCPPSSKLRTKKRNKLTQEDYLSRSQKLHNSYIQRPPVWASCCGDCSRCWEGTWSWWGWKWLVRKLPFLLALAMLLCGAVCAATGPQTGIWALEAGGYKFGGLGWCDSQESNCQEGVLYTGATADGQWPAMTVPILLLCFGFLAVTQLTFLLLTFLFIRHSSLSCYSDPESQSQKVKTRQQNPRRVKSLIWFERTMTFCGIAYSVVAAILAIWVSQTNAEGDVGYKLSTFLLVSPFVWFFLSISYRSRWAYNSNAFLSSASRRQKQGGKYEETSYEDPDKDEVIVSRNGTGAVGRPKRKLRKS